MNVTRQPIIPKYSATAAKGLLALAILFAHIYGFLGINSRIGTAFVGLMGYLPVAGFFALSGYGLMLSIKQKPEYINSFWNKR